MTERVFTPHGGPCENTDRELYREVADDYYAPSLHVTKEGSIGINVGGSVYVKPLREWHKLAGGPLQFPAQPLETRPMPSLMDYAKNLSPEARAVYIQECAEALEAYASLERNK